MPIYDVRHVPDFQFLPAQLHDIKQLPRWNPEENNGEDLEGDKYVATVGYTANTFAPSGKDSGSPATPMLLMNVMFVIILGSMV